jgi:4-methylaminobutanoate oxidase (formaldehyde-forming)
MEKGYLYWSADISPETNPYEAGLGFAIRLEKDDFLGRDALARIKAEGPRRRLVSFSVDRFAPFHGGETILFDGKVVGSTTSAGFGHTLRQTIAFGYVPAGLAGETDFEIVAFGQPYRAKRGPRCLYDAKNERLKA